MKAHWLFENQLYISVLNWFILFDSFISSGREFQILGPKNLRDLIPYLALLTSGYRAYLSCEGHNLKVLEQINLS